MPVPTNPPITSNNAGPSRPPINRTRSLISRFLCGARPSSPADTISVPAASQTMANPSGATSSSAVANTREASTQQSLRRNPHRRSTGNLPATASLRRTFPIPSHRLLINVRRDLVSCHATTLDTLTLSLVVDAAAEGSVELVNPKKGNSLVHSHKLSPGMAQKVNIIIATPKKQETVWSLVARVGDTVSREEDVIRRQQTDFELLRSGPHCLLRIIGQTVEASNGEFSLLEIYGRPISHSKEGDDAASVYGGSSRECIVCLSADRDTIVLPCRHLCLCAECAESLRNRVDKCPLCRESCQGLLQVRMMNSASGTIASSSESISIS